MEEMAKREKDRGGGISEQENKEENKTHEGSKNDITVK